MRAILEDLRQWSSTGCTVHPSVYQIKCRVYNWGRVYDGCTASKAALLKFDQIWPGRVTRGNYKPMTFLQKKFSAPYGACVVFYLPLLLSRGEKTTAFGPNSLERMLLILPRTPRAKPFMDVFFSYFCTSKLRYLKGIPEFSENWKRYTTVKKVEQHWFTLCVLGRSCSCRSDFWSNLGRRRKGLRNAALTRGKDVTWRLWHHTDDSLQ